MRNDSVLFVEKSKVKVSIMDCNGCREQLNAYLDKELTAVDQAQVEEHLCRCEQCRRELCQIEKVREVVSHLQIQAPSDFANQVIQQLRTDKVDRKRKIRRLVSGFCAVAACLLLVFSGPAILWRTGNKKSEQVMDQYEAQEAAYAEPREVEDVEGALTGEEVIPEESFYSESTQAQNGATSESGQDGDPASGNCLVESVTVEMCGEDMQWLIRKLQSFLGNEADLYLEETEEGYLLYDVAQYEEQLQQWLQERGYQLPEYAAEMLYVELLFI